MQVVDRSFGSVALVSVALLAAMASAATPSVEELEKHIQSASQAVEFSHVSGSETPNSFEITVPPHSKVVVRLRCASGYRGVLLSVQEGSAGFEGTPEQNLSSEDVLALVEGTLPMPRGIKVKQPVPYKAFKGVGLVGAPVPFVSVVDVGDEGDYTLVFSIMRVWMPKSGTRYNLRIHVAKEGTEQGKVSE